MFKKLSGDGRDVTKHSCQELPKLLRSPVGSDCAVTGKVGEGGEIIFTVAGTLKWSCPVFCACLNLWRVGRKIVCTGAVCMLCSPKPGCRCAFLDVKTCSSLFVAMTDLALSKPFRVG